MDWDGIIIKMAASMVVFVFGYVFMMRILYKLSILLADWVTISVSMFNKEFK